MVGCARRPRRRRRRRRRRLHAVLQAPRHVELQGRRAARNGEGDGGSSSVFFFFCKIFVLCYELAEVWLNLRLVCANVGPDFVFQKNVGAATGEHHAPSTRLAPVRPQAAIFSASWGPNDWRCSNDSRWVGMWLATSDQTREDDDDEGRATPPSRQGGGKGQPPRTWRGRHRRKCG